MTHRWDEVDQAVHIMVDPTAKMDLAENSRSDSQVLED